MKKKEILIVDLDGTFLKTDILWESVINLVHKKKFNVIFSLIFLSKTEAKEKLFKYSSINYEILPVNNKVFNLVKKWNKKNLEVILVSGSNQKVLEEIKSIFPYFNNVFGSDSKVNLVGQNKANFIKEKFGNRVVYYIGNSKEDIPVWKISDYPITCNISSSLSKKVKNLKKITHIQDKKKYFKILLRSLRFSHWVKNFLIFIPLIAAQDFSKLNFLTSIFAFLSFSLIASSVYIFNDLLDLNSDRNHFYKKNRTLASGDLDIKKAIYLMMIILMLGLFTSLYVGIDFFLILLFYLILNFFYTIYLKKINYVDILLLSFFYNLRIFAGGFAHQILPSLWLSTFTFFFFLSLSSLKRQSDLVINKQSNLKLDLNRSYKHLHLKGLSIISIVSSSLSFLILGFYLSSKKVELIYNYPLFLWGVLVILMIWFFRLYLLVQKGKIQIDPVLYAIKDKLSWFFLISIFFTVIISSQ